MGTANLDILCKALGYLLADLWAHGSRVAALAQLHHTLYDSENRQVFESPNQTNAYETRTLASAAAGRLDSWTPTEWEREIRVSPYAVLQAIDKCCGATAPTLNSDGADVLLPNALYNLGISTVKVIADLGTSNERKEVISVYVLKNPHRSYATGQGGSRHYYTPNHWCFPVIRDGFIRRVKPLRSQVTVDTIRTLVSSRQPLKVALVELPEVVHKAHIRPEPGKESRWLSGGLENESLIRDAVLFAIQRAREDRVHVVQLGELCGTEAIWNALIAEIQSVEWQENPMIVIGPTRHEIGSDGKARNICRALDAQGIEIDEATHTKINWVSLSRVLDNHTAIEEAIEPGTELSLVATDAGLMLIVICHDLSQALQNHSLVRALSDLPLRILFVPSMSKSTTAHQRAAQFVNLESDAHVVVANQSLVKFWIDDTTSWLDGGSFWRRGEVAGNLALDVEVIC